MEHLPEDLFDDLMLDLIGKYSGPRFTAETLNRPAPSEPQPQTSEEDCLDDAELACAASSASSEADSQEEEEDTSLQGDEDFWQAGSHTEIEERATEIWEPSGLDSSKETSLQGDEDFWRAWSHREREELASESYESSGFDASKYPTLQEDDNCWRAGSHTETEELASESYDSSRLDSRKDTSSLGDARLGRSGSSAERHEQDSSSSSESSDEDSSSSSSSSSGSSSTLRSVSPAERKDISNGCSESSDQHSRKDTSSSGHSGPPRSGSPAERKEQASNSRSQPRIWDSRKDTSSSGHADRRRSGSPAERKEKVSTSPSKPSDRDSRKDTSSPAHADRRRSRNPAKRKEKVSTSPLKPSDRDSRKDTSSSVLADHRRSRSLAKRKKKVTTGPSKPSDRDSRKDTSSSAHANHRRSRSPVERKEHSSSNRSETNGRDSRKDTLQLGQGWRQPNSINDGYALTKLKAILQENNFAKQCEELLYKWIRLEEKTLKSASLRRVNGQPFTNFVIAFKMPPCRELHLPFFDKRWSIYHQSFQTISMDSDVYELLRKTSDPEVSTRFLKNIEPLDKKLQHIQGLFMKATMPLFMICNFSELHGIQRTDEIPTLKETLYLCREAMIMFGRVFSYITNLRQEMVLDNFGFQGKPPLPLNFPNIESATLFGSKYMSELSRFHEEKQEASATSASPTKEADPKNVDVPGRGSRWRRECCGAVIPWGLREEVWRCWSNRPNLHVDEKTKCAIDKLARFVVDMGLEMDVFNVEKMACNPNFGFLKHKESSAYRLYVQKLIELKLSRRLSSECRKGEIVNPNSHPNPQGFALAPKEGLAQSLHNSSDSSVPPKKDCFLAPLAPAPRRRTRTVNAVAVPAKKICQEKPPEAGHPQPEHTSSAFHSRTMESAEKLARFVHMIGPKKEKEIRHEIISNPKYWFMKHVDSSAYKFYLQTLTNLLLTQPSPSSKPTATEIEVLERKTLPHADPPNPSSRASEALMLLSEVYDSDEEEEEDSKPEELRPQDIKHRAAQLQKARLKKSILKASPHKPPSNSSLRNDPNLGIRLL